MRTAAAILAAGAIALAAGTARAAIAADLITSLPGWSGSTPTPQYSGLLDIGAEKYAHYWFVGSETATAATDPVVMWFNGGPGCSSLEGFFQEQGPFNLNYTTGGEPVLSVRPTRWNSKVNMLFIEAPVGVGLSYSTDPANYVTNDTQTAVDNYHTLLQFFQGFPEFLSNELYITGESYAGVYVPTLAYQIVTNNVAGAPTQLNLKGILVGNGCTGTDLPDCGVPETYPIHFDLWLGKGLVSQQLGAAVAASCNFAKPTDHCLDLLAEAHLQVGPVNIYDIYHGCHDSWDPLPSDDSTTSGKRYVGDDDLPNEAADDHIDDHITSTDGAGSSAADATPARPQLYDTVAEAVAAYGTDEYAIRFLDFSRKRPISVMEIHARQLALHKWRVELAKQGLTSANAHRMLGHPGVQPGPGPVSCGHDGTMLQYLNTAAVRSALHVATVAVSGEWHDCTQRLTYTSTETNEPKDIYPTLVKAGLRIQIYNGNVDSCVPYNANEMWTSAFGEALGVKTVWRPWYYGGDVLQVGGYLTQYESDFSFITINDAGHMVPEFQPEAMFSVFENFVFQTR